MDYSVKGAKQDISANKNGIDHLQQQIDSMAAIAKANEDSREPVAVAEKFDSSTLDSAIKDI